MMKSINLIICNLSKFMKFISIFLLASLAINPAFAKGNKPCSGKKGGIKHCTSGKKFMCNDGSISSSKKVCNR